MTGYAGTGKSWVDLPSTSTPVQAADLLTMEDGILHAWQAGSRLDNLSEFNGAYGSGFTTFDQEFDAAAGTTSPPSGWAWVNQGSSTYLEQLSAGTISAQTGSGTNYRMLVRSLSGANSTWVATTKLLTTGQIGGSYQLTGLLLREAGSGKFVVLHQQNVSNVEIGYWTSPTVDSSHPVSAVGFQGLGTAFYAQIKKNSSTSFDFLASGNGVTWSTVLSAYNITGVLGFTPDQIGFGINNINSASGQVGCDWFRLR